MKITITSYYNVYIYIYTRIICNVQKIHLRRKRRCICIRQRKSVILCASQEIGASSPTIMVNVYDF